MKSINPQFLVDDLGNRTSVLLSLSDYEALLEEIEDAEDTKLFEESMQEPNEDSISLDEYMIKRGLMNE
ncbi:MAG: hypothetical protein IPK35_18715 [Saprospiraceae bacterium]|nr:hypothetical protein [Saprospiraceae bacterium]